MKSGPTKTIADELTALLPASPDVYPQKLDLIREAILCVRFDAAAYRAASFLDDRILGPATQGAWVPADVVAEAVRRSPVGRPLHFIFHTGHVGSTLVSRLLEESGATLALREPLPLRTLADAHDLLAAPDSLLSQSQFGRYLALFLTLWGRGYDTTRAVVLKATSSAGRLAVPVLARSADSRAIYLNLGAEPYLASLLAGQNTPLDLRGHGPERMRRLQVRVAAPLAPLHALSLGEIAAASWLSETWTLREAVLRFPERLIAIDFDRFLANPEQGMGRIMGHLDIARDPRFLAGIAQSPVLNRYSKGPEHPYSPGMRSQILADSRRANRAEIQRGLAWLERLARSDSHVGAIVDGAGTGCAE